MEHLALNVYCWGPDEEDRLIARCVGPLVDELRRDGVARRFWFTRFDARGPHVLCVVSGDGRRIPELRARLHAAVDAYLARSPSRAVFADGELERRHAECRGACLCAIDGEPGIARNNTFRVAPHRPDDYPFRAAAGAEFADELWELLTDESLWAARRLPPASRSAAAVLWVHGLDEALRRAGEDPGEYWRYHAGTILLGLQDRLDRDGESFLAVLPGLVGERNWALLSRAWREAEHDPAAWPLTGRLASLVAAQDARSQRERLSLVRIINHGVLAQLGLPVALRLPLLLYAWLRTRPDAPRA